MIITDCLTLDASGLSLSKDGYLVGEARVSRAGNVQQYSGAELGMTGDSAGQLFGVYRDPDVVFDEASMLSLAGRPVTRNHPPFGVTAESWKDLAVGQMGGTIKRDGEHVVAPMAIMDAAAIKEVQSGARSLSAGYTVEIAAADGIAPDGTAYQYKQAGQLRFNHVAYLPDNNPRAGNTRIGDGANAKWGASPYYRKDAIMANDANTRTVLIDGLSVVTTDAGAQALEKLQGQIADAAKAATAKDAAHAAAIAAKDAEIAKADAAKDAADAKVLSDADIDKRVADRADLIATAKAIHADVKTDGMPDAEIRKAVVVAKLGDAMAAKDAAYIDVRFDILSEDAGKGDKVADAIKDAKPVTDLNAAYAARNASLQDAWKSSAKKEA
jgi:hypothetical protein